MQKQTNTPKISNQLEVKQQNNNTILVKQEMLKQNEQINQVQFGSMSKGTQEEERIFAKICKYLQDKNHEATRTSQQSAAIRKTPLQWGAKTMLVSGLDNSLILLIYRANRKISWKKIRKIQQVGKKSQMASEHQVLKLGVKPGGVPPFPHMIGIKGILDSKFKQVENTAFNAGHKCKSIVMKTVDFPLQDVLIDDITQE